MGFYLRVKRNSVARQNASSLVNVRPVHNFRPSTGRTQCYNMWVMGIVKLGHVCKYTRIEYRRGRNPNGTPKMYKQR